MMENEYFVGWGTLALINAGLAQGKNRSGLNWFLLTLVLGPLATLILLFAEKRDQQHLFFFVFVDLDVAKGKGDGRKRIRRK